MATSSSRDSPLKFTSKLFFERKGLAIWIIIGIIIHQSLRFVIPVWLGLFIDEGLKQGLTDQAILYVSLMLITGLLSAFFDLTMSWGNEIAANHVETEARSLFFNSILGKRQAFHDKSVLGEQMAVAQNDLRSLYQAVAPGVRLFGEGMTSIITITILIFLEAWALGAVFLILMPVWWWSIVNFDKRLTPRSVAQQQNFRILSGKVKENLGAAAVVRAFNQEPSEIRQFQVVNRDFTNSWIQRGKTLALYTPLLVAFFMSGLIFVVAMYFAITPEVVVYGITLQTSANQITIGAVATIVTLVIQFRGPTQFMQATLEFSSLGFAGIEKIQDTLEDVNEELPVLGTDHPDTIEGDVVFRDVSFKYDSHSEHYILQNISFKVPQGHSVAIIGPTGSGKSTLIKLLTRLYDVTSGEILIDNTPVTHFKPSILRKSIGLVEQDIFLFSKSIYDNIVYAVDRELDLEEVIQVAKKAQAHEFISDYSLGYETLVGERGTRLSGGQKQRIAIARAFLSDPRVLVLDDATSAVDAKTEAQIILAIRELMRERTTFLITSRLNLIKEADFVLVLDEGRIAGFDTHERLIRSNEIYRRIFGPHVTLPPLEAIS